MGSCDYCSVTMEHGHPRKGCESCSDAWLSEKELLVEMAGVEWKWVERWDGDGAGAIGSSNRE